MACSASLGKYRLNLSTECVLERDPNTGIVIDDSVLSILLLSSNLVMFDDGEQLRVRPVPARVIC
jgi:hypothetical protein